MQHITHVLIVEDDEVVRRALVRCMHQEIEKHGLPADVSEADRADQAFGRILADPGDRWFLVTDNVLNRSDGPVQTGFDLIQRVHDNVPRIRSYRILVSGGEMDTADFALFGIDRFMPKPTDIAAIMDLLAAFISSE